MIDYRDFELVDRTSGRRAPPKSLDVARKSRTILKFDKLEYDLPLKDDDFTVEALRRDS